MRALYTFLMIVSLLTGVYFMFFGVSIFGPNKKIYVILQDKTDNPYWTDVIRGAKAGATSGFTVSVDAPGEEVDYMTQAKLIRKAVAEKADAIVIAPINRKLIIDELEKARAANIKIIFVDNVFAWDGVTARVQSDNYTIGELAAEHVVEDGGKRVVILRGDFGDASHDERVQGCQEVFASHGQQVAAVLIANSERTMAKAELAKLLALRKSRIDCVFATNDEMALGAIEAINESGIKGGKVVSVDGTPRALNALKLRELDATVAQNPYMIGKIGIETAMNEVMGKQYAYDTIVDSVLVTQVDRHRIADNIEVAGEYSVDELTALQSQQQGNPLSSMLDKYMENFKKYISDSMNINKVALN